MTLLDFLAFGILWWTSAATLAGGDHVHDWRDAVFTLATIALCVCSFVCAIATLKGFGVLSSWWIRGVIHAAAVLAVFAYDVRFGVGRHARMAYRSLRARIKGAAHA